MDIPSERARRKNRSNTNLQHLSLAPLTSKLPLDTDSQGFDHPFGGGSASSNNNLAISTSTTSYLQGRSAPTTPRLISHSPSTPRHHRRNPSAPGAHINIAKSKSSTQLAKDGRKGGISGTMTPGRRYGKKVPDDPRALGEKDRQDSDWLLRTAATMFTEARESKGQAWLVSRQSSTSLAGVRNEEDEAFEDELRREREWSRRGSEHSFQDHEYGTPMGSRFASRSASQAGRRSRLMTPGEREEGDSYFPGHHSPLHNEVAGPDFVNLDERLEALEREDTTQADEADVRRLLKSGNKSRASWLWGLWSVDEGEFEGSEDEGDIDGATESVVSSVLLSDDKARGDRRFEGQEGEHREEGIAPPKADEGGWQDAAWLLSVASKVMF